MHLLTDIERERVLESLGFYKLFPPDPNVQRASKLLEETLVWSYRNNWKEIIVHLQNILKEELEFTDETTIRKWHNILVTYFQEKPSIRSAISLAENLGFPKNFLTDITQWMEKISQSKQATAMLTSIHQKLFYE